MKHPPYHLRTNKAVDRLLLVEVIRNLCSQSQLLNNTYYTFGGPFLQDLRVMDHFFPTMSLVSIESNKQTYKRQQFNQFCSRIDLHNITFANFLTRYEPSPNDIFWLDYTDLKFERFDEFQRLLRKVLPTTIIRITLRAVPEIEIGLLRSRLSETEIDRLLNVWQKGFEEEFDAIIPDDIDLREAFDKRAKFANLVKGMVNIAASKALDFPGSKTDFIPVQVTRYEDHTQMVSVTGVVCRRGDEQNIRDRLQAIRFANFDWGSCDKIDIPDLTVKERLHLEAFLPTRSDEDAGEILHEALGYAIDNGERRSKGKLTQYATCHRDYPNFIRALI